MNFNCLLSPTTITLRALYSTGSAVAISHWLASSIITTSNKLLINGILSDISVTVVHHTGNTLSNVWKFISVIGKPFFNFLAKYSSSVLSLGSVNDSRTCSLT